MKRLSLPERALTTVLGTGYSPVAPATVASAVTCGGFWFVPELLRWPLLLLLIPALPLGVWLSTRAIGAFPTTANSCFRKLRRPDPKPDDPDHVVIDEFIGQWIVLAAVPHTAVGFIAAFVVFRLFDILKPLGIGAAQRLPRGWGIVIDDVLAGLYGAALLLPINALMD